MIEKEELLKLTTAEADEKYGRLIWTKEVINPYNPRDMRQEYCLSTDPEIWGWVENVKRKPGVNQEIFIASERHIGLVEIFREVRTTLTEETDVGRTIVSVQINFSGGQSKLISHFE